jgi:hypothetical protein
MNSFYSNYQFENSEIDQEVECRGGLCLSKTLIREGHSDPISQRFKDLVVPIGLILENRSTDLHNHFLNIDDGLLQPVPEGMFEKFFVSMNGQMEKGTSSTKKTRKNRK